MLHLTALWHFDILLIRFRRFRRVKCVIIHPCIVYTSHEKDYCEKCGEANHLTINCFHKQAIQCHDCQMVGHKGKLCSYYHWGGGQGRLSKLRQDKTRDNFNINNFQNINSGVFVNRVQCLTFGHLNVRSLLPKIDEIRCILNSHNFDVFAVCESWLNHTITDSEIAVHGYGVHRKDRPNSIGGGVCLYVKNDYTFTVSNDLMFDDVEALWGELKLDSRSLLISVIYRPPSSGSSHFNYLLDMIENATKKKTGYNNIRRPELWLCCQRIPAFQSYSLHWIFVWYVSINHREDQGDPEYREYSRCDFNYESISP